MATPAMYAPTPPGAVEIKQLPALNAYEANARGDFFRERNALFGKDFAFLAANRIAMTVPVEADVEPAAMRFFVPEGVLPERPVEGVRLVAMPERTVLSAGLRGNYSRASFDDGLWRLREWLDERPAWRPHGEPYVVYWDAPMKPWFLKRSEVHLRVSQAPSTRASASAAPTSSTCP